MYNFNLKKMMLQRKLRSSRGKFPLYNFFEQYNLIEKLYWEIEKNIEKTQLVLQARRQLVISLVGAMEVYFKDSVKEVIDNTAGEYDLLLMSFRQKFTLKDIENILKYKLSMGEIISSLCSFSTLVGIDKIFSKLLGGADFFYNLNNFEFSLEDENTSTSEKTKILLEDKDMYIHLKQMFMLRQNLSHDQSNKLTITENQVQDFFTATSLFAIVTNEYFKKMFYSNKKQYRTGENIKEDESTEDLQANISID